MKIGLLLHVSPRNLAPFTLAAEQAGFESVWIGEHLILPEHVAGHPGVSAEDAPAISSDVPLYDPWLQIAYLAGQTKRIRLGTSVYNLGLRHPFVTARAITTADALSGGRVEVGIGVSWLEAEWDAVQLPFATRGRRTDETIHILKSLFSENVIAHEGEFFRFGPVKFFPKPVQSPWPPLLIGGNSKAAIRRAALAGDGWLPMPQDIEKTAADMRQLESLRREANRTQPFSVTILDTNTIPTLESIKRYEDIGVDRVIVVPWQHVRQGLEAIARTGDDLIGRLT
jgi:probable F420-dependent oxidoreductase